MDIEAQLGSKQSRWQAYVDDALLLTGQVTEAAICGLDGSKWAASKSINVNQPQLASCMVIVSTTIHR